MPSCWEGSGAGHAAAETEAETAGTVVFVVGFRILQAGEIQIAAHG